MSTSSPLLVSGLATLAPYYRAVLCDVWGVLHNGVAAFPDACRALQAFRRETGAPVVLLTNAPRPSQPILEQLARLGVPDDAFDAVVTSGDVTRAEITANRDAPILHIGPERDRTLFAGLNVALAEEETARQIVCTGLFDDETETPEDYRPLLERLIARDLPFICANPDIVVERGSQMIWCAGAIGRLYEDLGGRVTIQGKPHAPIYQAAMDKIADLAGTPVARDAVLAIGDGLPTDIRGAVSNDLDVLFITGGIHGKDFGPTDAPDDRLIRRRLSEEGLTARAALPYLVW